MFRYLTRMQMAQFVLVFLHSVQTLYFDCNYPKVVAKVTSPTHFRYPRCKVNIQAMIINMVIFFVLFGNYYFYAYITKKKDSRRWTIQKLHGD